MNKLITLKIPYKTSEENLKTISKLQQEYSNVVRYSYNRVLDKISQKEIRSKVKDLNNISNLNSWFVQCAILEALSIHKRNKNNKVIFGGKSNFYNRIKHKISNEEFKERRLLLISIQGEKLKNGNRSFDLKHLDENKIIFKVNKKTHLELQLPNLKSNYRKKLAFIEQMIQTQDLTVSIKLNQKYIYLTYEEKKENIEKLDNRYLGIDLNPNYIGISIKEDGKILYTKCYDFSSIAKEIMSESNSSDSERFKYLNNKLKFETLEVSKDITSLAKSYKVKFVFIEDLKNISKNNFDFKKLNRLTKNLWKRDYFIQNLTKRLSLMNVKLFKVNPMYSSIIGNLQHEYFDPINASLEIARRGY